MLSNFVQDARYTLRQLRRSPVFTATVLLTMALSIGATAALAGILRATIWNTLPYPSANQLVTISDHNRLKFAGVGLTAVGRIDDLAALRHDGHPVFSAVAFFYPNQGSLTVSGHEPQPVLGGAVSGNFFNMAQATPLLGRTLRPADDVQNGPLVTVLSYGLWQSTFASDPAMVGRVVRLGDQQATVVGVMGPHFDLPQGMALWYPGHIFSSSFHGYRGEGSRFLNVIARLDPHESQASANIAIQSLANQLATRFPDTDDPYDFRITSLRDALFGEYHRALVLLVAAIALVLLIAATNIAGLQLARNAARQAEFGIRGALGISRARLLQQLLTENILLVLAGSLLGLAAATFLLKLLLSRLPPALLSIDHPHVDFFIFSISLAVSAATGILAGILPWLQAAKLFDPATRITANRIVGAQSQRSGNLFVTAQIALSMVLLTVAASVLHNLYTLLRTPLGFTTANVVTFTVDLPWSSEMVQRHQLYSTLEQRIASTPGILGTGAISALPLVGFSMRLAYDVAGQPATPSHDSVVAEGRDITPGYSAAMHVALLAGRMFTPQDSEPHAPGVFLANHAFAERYFPGSSVIGRHLTSTVEDLHLPPGGKGIADAGEIIGILDDVQGTAGNLGSPAQPELYRPELGGWPHMQFAVRTAAPIPGLEQQIRRDVAKLSPTASVSHFDTLIAAVDRSEAQPRLNSSLLTAFGAFALLLTIIGTYGLAAFGLAQRSREFAVRMALGSTRQAIFALLFQRTLLILAAGLAIGLAANLAVTRLLASTDAAGTLTSSPALLVTTSALLSVAVLLATFFPARRAATIEPVEALRAE